MFTSCELEVRILLDCIEPSKPTLTSYLWAALIARIIAHGRARAAIGCLPLRCPIAKGEDFQSEIKKD